MLENANMRRMFLLIVLAALIFAGGCVWNAQWPANALPEVFFHTFSNGLIGLGSVFVNKVRSAGPAPVEFDAPEAPKGAAS